MSRREPAETKTRARLKDIAQATGFSSNTVSLALRNSPRLPEKTREIILEAAHRLNYSPNHIARSLVSSSTRTIGLVMTDIMNPTLTLAARTIERELASAGYGVMFAASDGHIVNEQRAVELFLSYQVDGMLVYPADRQHHRHLSDADASGTPVLLLVDIPESGLDTVTINDEAGAYKAVAHLCQLGHQRIAMLDGGRPLGNLDKRRGACRAMRDAGLVEADLISIEPEGHAPSKGYAAMSDILNSSSPPTAVFATTDLLALGVLRWCQEHGIDVPNQLAVVGYDNTELSAYCSVPLTTVNYAADTISEIGVARMLQRIEHKAEWNGPRTQLIDPELVLRATTA